MPNVEISLLSIENRDGPVIKLSGYSVVRNTVWVPGRIMDIWPNVGDTEYHVYISNRTVYKSGRISGHAKCRRISTRYIETRDG